MSIHAQNDQIDTQPSTKPERPGISKILFLDGLRGIAILLVIAHHAGFIEERVNMGGVGVDIFFVLSAFLLTMIFEPKARAMIKQRATWQQWGLMLLDYFCKRLLRVYPLFMLVALVIWLLPVPLKERYYHVNPKTTYDLLEVLIFSPKYRYFVLWSLPIEMQYYCVIPIFSIGIILLRGKWWIASLVLSGWILYEGFTKVRSPYQHLEGHISTFVAGSLAAVVYIKIDQWRKQTGFEITKWQRQGLRILEYSLIGLFWSVSFQGLYFNAFAVNPVQQVAAAAHFITIPVAAVIVIEMLEPSEISECLEWSLFRAWGKVSFSAYLLHMFVFFTPYFQNQPSQDRLLLGFTATFVLASVSHRLVELPLHRLAVQISSSIRNVRAQLTGAAG